MRRKTCCSVSLAVLALAAGGGAEARIVARSGYATPVSWERPRIGGETYRPLMWNEGYWAVGGKAFAGQEKRYADSGLALFDDCAVTYTARQWPVRRIRSGKALGSPGLSAAEIQSYAHFVTNPPAPKTLTLNDFFGPGAAWEALEERARPSQPFFIAAHQVRPAFFLEKTYATDREGFRAWQAAHPNFLGFEALGEFDSDAFFYCWKGKEQFPKMEPALQRHFADGFAFPRDQYEWTNLVAEAWSRSSQLLFGRGDLIWPMCSGYFSLNHIFAHFGAAGLMYEATGQGCPRWQVAGAFTRGAARQYGLPFVWYQAHFMTLYRRGDYAKTVGGNNRWNQKPDAFGGPWKGCSRELFVRQSLYGWLIGASFVGIEDWPNLLSAPDAKGVRAPTAFARELNALGELHRKIDRGVSYTPVALLVPFTDRYSCWGHTDGIVDDISQNSFYLTLVPVGDDLVQLGLRRRGDEGCLFNSPYGEMYDVLNTDSGMPTDRLRASLVPYKCAFLVGTYRKGDLDVGALGDYVRSGGTLIVSADQVADGHVPATLSGVTFDGKTSVPSGASICLRDGRVLHALENPYAWLIGEPVEARPVLWDDRGGIVAYANAVGKGRVLTICAGKMRPVPELDKGAVARGEKTYDLIAWLLKRVQEETMPVAVSGDVQWGVNRTAKGFLVWLFNNRGVMHYSGEEPTVDPGAAVSATVRANVAASSVRDAVSGSPVDGADGAFAVTVPAGGYRLVELLREGPVR